MFEREIIDHASQQWYNDENKSGFVEVFYETIIFNR